MRLGEIAYGSFVFDVDIRPSGTPDFNPQYLSINITTTTGTIRSGAVYGDLNPESPGNPDFLYSVLDGSLSDIAGKPVLALSFSAPLTNAGGTVGILFPRTSGFTFESTSPAGLLLWPVLSKNPDVGIGGPVSASVAQPLVGHSPHESEISIIVFDLID